MFDIKTKTNSNKFLELSIIDKGKTVKIYNDHVMQRILVELRMEPCKPAGTLLSVGIEFGIRKSPKPLERSLYWQLTGALLDSLNTVRPDISYSVKYHVRYMHSSTKQVWRTKMHVFLYLKGTEEFGTIYTKERIEDFKYFFTYGLKTRKATLNTRNKNIIILTRCCVDWRFKQQTIIAQSSEKTKYIFFAIYICETL